MTRTRLLSLFGIATVVCATIFTTVVFNGHVDATNKLDLNYLQLYVEHVNELRRNGTPQKKIPIPKHITENKNYQIIVYTKEGELNYWLKTDPWFKPVMKHFPIKVLSQQEQTQGHYKIDGTELHWIKLSLAQPAASIFFIHPDSDHWQSFRKTFGSAIFILYFFIFWGVIWAAIILSNLFNRLHDKNTLLQKQAIDVCQARDEAYAAAKAKSRFVADISHELRTPLTAILGFSENMLDTNDTCISQTGPLQTIIRNGNHLLHVINELLDLAKLEEGQLQIERIPFSLVQLTQDIEMLMRHQAEDKDLDFRIIYNWPLPEKITGDPFRLKQILINLCANAFKFTAQGSVYINISCLPQEEQLHIEVIDTGIGIEADKHEQIFLPFNQADTSTTRQYGGSGLGLSLSKQFADLMGGSISLFSKINEGSCFTVSVPTGSLATSTFISELGHNKLPFQNDEKPDYTQLQGHVLIADDAPDSRLLVEMLLTKFGLTVESVKNGQEALDMLSETDFDLVLLDLQMPILGGLEAIKILKQNNFDKPILALTADTLIEDRKICESAGFTDFIAKPIRFQMLNKILARYLPKA